jgi:hypothetical protein
MARKKSIPGIKSTNTNTSNLTSNTSNLTSNAKPTTKSNTKSKVFSSKEVKSMSNFLKSKYKPKLKALSKSMKQKKLK